MVLCTIPFVLQTVTHKPLVKYDYLCIIILLCVIEVNAGIENE